MRRTISFSALVLCLGIGCLVLTGCGDQDKAPAEQEDQQEQAQTSSQQESPEQEQQKEKEEQEEEGSSLSSILSRVPEMNSAQYDLMMKTPGREDHTAHVWWKGDNMRVESTMSTQAGTFEAVYLVDKAEQTSYAYMPEQGRAIKMEYSQATEKTGDSPRSKSTTIRQNNPEVVGRETLNGKECTVVEYTPEGGDTTKAWIWEEHGFPIKTVTKKAEGEYVTLFENIDMSDIPDSEFELPEGVQVMDIPAGMGQGMSF